MTGFLRSAFAVVCSLFWSRIHFRSWCIISMRSCLCRHIHLGCRAEFHHRKRLLSCWSLNIHWYHKSTVPTQHITFPSYSQLSAFSTFSPTNHYSSVPFQLSDQQRNFFQAALYISRRRLQPSSCNKLFRLP